MLDLVHREQYAIMLAQNNRWVVVAPPSGVGGPRLMMARGVVFVREPKEAAYGTVAVFQDLYGNLWDLMQASH